MRKWRRSFAMTEEEREALAESELNDLLVCFSDAGFTTLQELREYVFEHWRDFRYRIIWGLLKFSTINELGIPEEWNWYGFAPECVDVICEELNLIREGNYACVVGFTSKCDLP